MIFARNTPNNAGVAVYGDHMDFENLYKALHTVVGNEDEFIECGAASIRVLGICYDLRHALMGDREIEFIYNGMDEEKKKRMLVLAPDKNVYLKIRVLWPEMLFVTIALNEFMELYAQKLAKTRYGIDLFVSNKVIWDHSIAQVRMLQAAVAECLKQTVSDNIYARILNILNGKFVYVDRYITQYLDILNERFIKMSKEKRLKNLSTIAKRIVERGQEYRDLELQLREDAKKYNCSVDDLRLDLDFPEDIEW
ncbi:MAG: hypothetical protein QHH10_09445 [Peptococcaceae bacterium]|jgi:hypothetical protein|nr:hypothetical protein [Peptococcaceae bacterium]MDH7525522.1 hypothetical protein [Peptococcaceae bacterium]